MFADGSQVRKITSIESETLHTPDWSPDGMFIAFSTSTVAGNDIIGDIAVINLETLETKNLINDSAWDIAPVWPPDGTQIAFSSDRDGLPHFDLYVMNSDGSNIVRLTRELDYSAVHPAWSPDGTKIAYTCDGASICLINADGSSRTKIIDHSLDFKDGNNPDWSPDGLMLAFESNRELDDAIFITRLNRLRGVRLTNGQDLLFAIDPAWQPKSHP
jgi:TolB protein